MNIHIEEIKEKMAKPQSVCKCRKQMLIFSEQNIKILIFAADE